MRSIRVQRLVRLGTGAILLLSVQAVAAPGSVLAGCNHLVTSRSNPYTNLVQLDELIPTGSSGEAIDTSVNFPPQKTPPARRLPCSGLACSSRDSMPVSTVSPEPDESDQWGTLIAQLSPEFAPPPIPTHGEPAPHSEAEKTSIFHPPRV